MRTLAPNGRTYQYSVYVCIRPETRSHSRKLRSGPLDPIPRSSRQLRVRIFVAKDALAEVAGTSLHEAVSSSQKEAVLDMIQREMRRACISKEEAAELVLMTGRAAWYGDDKHSKELLYPSLKVVNDFVTRSISSMRSC